MTVIIEQDPVAPPKQPSKLESEEFDPGSD